MVKDEAGREIYRARVFIDPEKTGMTAEEVNQKLEAGNPSIHCRPVLLRQGSLEFDPRPLVDGDKELIVEKMNRILNASV